MLPKRSLCRECTEPVLLVTLRGKRTELDLREVVPYGKCCNCRGQGKVPVSGAVASVLEVDNVICPSCQGTCVSGARPEAGMVCLNEKGKTRVLLNGQEPKEGEALHTLHAWACVKNLRRQPLGAADPEAAATGRAAAVQDRLWEEVAA